MPSRRLCRHTLHRRRAWRGPVHRLRNRQAGHQGPDQQAALDILETLRDNHILTSVCGRYGNILKLRPPLVFSESDVDWFMDGFTKTLETLKL